MRNSFIILSIFLSRNLLSKTAEEHYKEAEEYSEKSKQGYIFAAIALVFVIGVRYLNKGTDKKDKE